MEKINSFLGMIEFLETLLGDKLEKSGNYDGIVKHQGLKTHIYYMESLPLSKEEKAQFAQTLKANERVVIVRYNHKNNKVKLFVPYHNHFKPIVRNKKIVGYDLRKDPVFAIQEYRTLINEHIDEFYKALIGHYEFLYGERLTA